VMVVLAAAAVIGYQTLGPRGSRAESPLADLPDSAYVDSAARPDTLDPTDGLALKLEGLRALRERNWAVAEQNLASAIMFLPADVQARDAYAFALLNLGRPADAERVLLEARQLDPGYDLVYSHLADALLAQGDTVRARTALERFVGLTLDPAARDEATRRLQALAPAPAPQPVPEAAPQPGPEAPADTLRMPSPSPAPRDSIRLGTPPENPR
jgi:Flp pilus assembly protein TadD